MKLFEIRYEVHAPDDDQDGHPPREIVVYMYAPNIARAKQRVHEELKFVPSSAREGFPPYALYEYHPGTTVKILEAKEL